MILSLIQSRSGDRQNGVNFCTRKNKTPKAPVPQTSCQKSQGQKPVGGNITKYALGTSPPLRLARKRYCSHMLVILGGLSDSQIDINDSCMRGRAMQMWLYHFRADSSPKPVLFLSLNA